VCVLYAPFSELIAGYFQTLFTLRPAICSRRAALRAPFLSVGCRERGYDKPQWRAGERNADELDV
jgi:hypothetical protein